MPRYQTGKLAKRRRRLAIFRIILAFIFIAVLITGTSYWSHANRFNINEIKVSGVDFVNADEVENLVQEKISGKHWFGYSKSNIALYPKGEIRDSLLSNYGAIKNVKVKNRGLTKIEVIIEEFLPIARWCDNEGKCYLVNIESRPFAEEPLIHDYELIALHGVISENPIESIYVSDSFLKNVNSFNDLLKTIELKITDVTTEDQETFDLLTDSGLEILIDKSDDINVAFENLLTVINQEAIHTEQFRNIEYIDLRFGNKVIYKLKEWE